jgi:hypothetical protein
MITKYFPDLTCPRTVYKFVLKFASTVSVYAALISAARSKYTFKLRFISWGSSADSSSAFSSCSVDLSCTIFQFAQSHLTNLPSSRDPPLEGLPHFGNAKNSMGYQGYLFDDFVRRFPGESVIQKRKRFSDQCYDEVTVREVATRT